MKCKNDNCNNETKNKNIFCSLKCRNVYVNKNIRDYSKNKETNKNKRNKQEIEYLKNPKKCKNCDKIINFKDKRNIFCNHTCSASYSNKNRRVTWGEKIKKSIHKYLIENNIKNENEIGHYDLICNECGKKFIKKKKIKYCSSDCRNNAKTKNMTEYRKYYRKSQFKFSLNDFKEEFDFTLIKKYGWYKAKNKGDNLNGVSRDHMISIKEGYENNIDPQIISHPANCRLILQKENSSKWKKSILTIDELIKRIDYFQEKYKDQLSSDAISLDS